MLSESTGQQLLDEIYFKELKSFNFEQVNILKNEIDFVDKKLDLLKQEAEKYEITEDLSINFSILKSYKNRNERILKAYTFNRLLKITDNFFKKYSIVDKLNNTEVNFHLEYMKLCENYLKPYKHLDLINREPPLDFYVQIITLEDCGIILNGDEFIDLKKNRLYYLKKSDISHLIEAKLVNLL